MFTNPDGSPILTKHFGHLLDNTWACSWECANLFTFKKAVEEANQRREFGHLWGERWSSGGLT